MFALPTLAALPKTHQTKLGSSETSRQKPATKAARLVYELGLPEAPKWDATVSGSKLPKLRTKTLPRPDEAKTHALRVDPKSSG